MDAKIGSEVVLVSGGKSYAAVVTGVYGDERSCVDLRYVDEAYVDPAPDPKPDDWQAPEPRRDVVNVTAVPHASSAGESAVSWRVTAPTKLESKPKPETTAPETTTAAEAQGAQGQP
jgi:hypothetical protein